jgi:Flp pilus assembly pilin Flp
MSLLFVLLQVALVAAVKGIKDQLKHFDDTVSESLF